MSREEVLFSLSRAPRLSISLLFGPMRAERAAEEPIHSILFLHFYPT